MLYDFKSYFKNKAGKNFYGKLNKYLCIFKFISCSLDYYCHKLTEGGEEVQCGWLKDKFGVSWQVIPEVFTKMFNNSDSAKTHRAMGAVFHMKKFYIAKLEEAFNG